MPDVERREIEVQLDTGERMPALLTLPENDRAPGILVVCDIYGRSPFYEALAARLATAGFAALLPEYFFRLPPLTEISRELAIARRQRLDENRTLEDLRRSLGWLRGLSGHEGPLGTVGFCMGGTLVLDLAAVEGELATVCYYGFPAGTAKSNAAFVPPAPLDRARFMTGSILGFWGDQDAAVGMDNVAALDRALQASEAEFQYRVYPGLGHGFLSASRLEESGAGYREACESWTMALDHWRRHLAPARRPV